MNEIKLSAAEKFVIYLPVIYFSVCLVVFVFRDGPISVSGLADTGALLIPAVRKILASGEAMERVEDGLILGGLLSLCFLLFTLSLLVGVLVMRPRRIANDKGSLVVRGMGLGFTVWAYFGISPYRSGVPSGDAIMSAAWAVLLPAGVLTFALLMLLGDVIINARLGRKNT